MLFITETVKSEELNNIQNFFNEFEAVETVDVNETQDAGLFPGIAGQMADAPHVAHGVAGSGRLGVEAVVDLHNDTRACQDSPEDHKRNRRSWFVVQKFALVDTIGRRTLLQLL